MIKATLNQLIKAYAQNANFHPFEGNVLVRDKADGKGPYIDSWNEEYLGPRPTMEQLEARRPQVEAELEKELKANEAKTNETQNFAQRVKAVTDSTTWAKMSTAGKLEAVRDILSTTATQQLEQ